MFKELTREKFIVIVVITALFLSLSYVSGVLYIIFLRPTFGLRYANIFFMVSFSIIFFSMVYIYHIWITKIQGEEEP